MKWNFGGFDAPGNWYRGNLHLHTDRSDGAQTPEETVGLYADAGYDFVAITDHTSVMGGEGVPPHPAEALSKESFIVLHGAEYAWYAGHETVHVVAVGPGYDIQPKPEPDASASLQAWWHAGGFAWWAHPYWSNNSTQMLEKMNFLPGVEVWNYLCEVETNKGLSAVHIDRVLSQKKDTLLLAVDDCHDTRRHSCGGWVMVKAEELTEAAIVAALRRGDFYASSGPSLESVHLEESGKLTINCSPVRVAKLISKNGAGQRIELPRGATFTDAEFMFSWHDWDGKDQPYLRVEVMDEYGNTAWSQAVSKR